MFQTKKPSSRYTIGLLAGWPVYGSYAADRFVDHITQGLKKFALEQDCNLLLALGVSSTLEGRSTQAAWPLVSDGTDFIPVGHWNTDGLIVLAPIRSQSRTDYIQERIAEGFPVVFIGNGAGQPSVSVDNEAGIKQAVGHLFEHGHRRIAFLAGDTNDPGDSLIRLHAYHQAIQDFGLERDPRLVEYGYYDREYSYLATDKMLRSGVSFSALLASNDMSATGAMQAIRDNGLRIPEDVAVIGFDDQPVAAGQDPPLSSIHYPLFEAGYQAGSLLMQALKFGREIKSTTLLLSPRLAARRSCGCLPGKEQAWNTILPATRKTKKFQIAPTVQQMTQSVSSQANTMPPDEIRKYCQHLTEAFTAALRQKNADLLHKALNEILLDARTAGESLHIWQEAITVLSEAGLPSSRVAGSREFANMLLHRARVEISENIQHQQEQTLINQTSITHQLSWLSSYLFAARDEPEIFRALASLPLIGIKFLHIALFEAEGKDPVARVRYCIPSLDQTGSPENETTDKNLKFPTREYPPDGLFEENLPYHLALLPLVLPDTLLGFVVFDTSNMGQYAAIARELAAAIKSTQLHAKILEMSQTDGLTNIYNRRFFEECFAKELERSRRYSRPLALIMIDLDHFKDYNDAFGHPAGDRALQEFAQVIRNEVRRNLDIVARYGGEEFVIVMPESTLDNALNLAERIRARLEASGALRSRLTTSIGVTACLAGRPDGDTLLSQADMALYKAKKSGRNRVCTYP